MRSVRDSENNTGYTQQYKCIHYRQDKYTELYSPHGDVQRIVYMYCPALQDIADQQGLNLPHTNCVPNLSFICAALRLG